MFSSLQLDRTSTVPLQDQLFEQLRGLIIRGLIKPNARILATRFLADQVGVSRTTVLLVYERLISEGYLETKPMIGTFVSAVLPDSPIPKPTPEPLKPTVRQARLRPSVLKNLFASVVERHAVSFDFSRTRPESDLLPLKIWLRRTQNIMDQYGSEAAEPLPSNGLPVLRQALADWLAARRGIAITPEQIVVVSGLQQAYALVTHLFQKRGDPVVVESPGSESLRRFLESRGASLIAVTTDHQGLMTQRLPDLPRVSLACVAPARHHPLGGVLPTERREELIAWARKTGAYIIEDDTDSDFPYHGTMPPPLAAMDSYGLVFHIGSFAKTLGAGFCLVYVVAPPEFAPAVGMIKALSDDGCPWIEQRVLADFIVSGGYDTHLRRLRHTYHLRRDALIQALTSSFGEVRLVGTDSGTQLTWILPPDYPSATAIQKQAQAHIQLCVPFQEGDPCEIPNATSDRVLVLSYASLSESKIKQGISQLAQIIKDMNVF